MESIWDLQDSMKGVRWADLPEDDDDWMSSLCKNYEVTAANEDARVLPAFKEKVDVDDLLKWASWTKPFPLPDQMVAVGEDIFQDVSDEALLNAPPHMLVHLQRTAAQGGLQVISPRQIPMTQLMSRVGDTKRELGDHVVGSVAARDSYWPTLDNASFDHLLPDEPLPTIDREDYIRERTRTESLTSAGHLLKDPILNCLVKGRAVVDIQNREDVCGDAERLLELLAKAWDVDRSELSDLDAFTIGVAGPLLRHAIKSDDVYPTVHAPIHILKSISVSCNEASRELLPEDCAMDWRRMRVFCEAVYTMCASIEGVSIRDAIVSPPPGDPNAPLDRPGTMAFRPSPCVSWSFDPKSFSVNPIPVQGKKRRRALPRDVIDSISKYTRAIRPVTTLMSMGYKARARVSHAAEARHHRGENLSDGYRLIAKTILVGNARGKTAARAVRNLMHDAIESAPMPLRLRLARYISIAKTEVRTHLGLAVVPDRIIDRIANKFLKVGDTIRQKVAAEAARRGSTVAAWWSDILAQAPDGYRSMTEGTMGWTKVAMWLTFRAPTDKWDKMVKSIHYSAVRDSEVKSVGSLALPPEVGSVQRLVAGARGTVKGITSAYFGYYCAVADVGMAIADMLVESNQPRKADIIKEASYLWILRARALRGTNVDPVPCDSKTPSVNHLRVVTEPVDLLVVPAPYRAFEAYKAHMLTAGVVHKSVKRQLQEFDNAKVSRFFGMLEGPLAPAPESLLTRYILKPYEMERDLDEAWEMLRTDVQRVADYFEKEWSKRDTKVRKRSTELIPRWEPIAIPTLESMKKQKVAESYTYHELLCELDIDQVEWLEDLVDSLPPMTAEMMAERRFANVDEMTEAFLKLEESFDDKRPMFVETVV